MPLSAAEKRRVRTRNFPPPPPFTQHRRLFRRRVLLTQLVFSNQSYFVRLRTLFVHFIVGF